MASSTFVGRLEELQALEAARRRAANAEPALVLVGGEAGVGKTRLVAELLRDAGGLGAVALSGGCLDVAVGAWTPRESSMPPVGVTLYPTSAITWTPTAP
jgi:AAA ATPase domain